MGTWYERNKLEQQRRNKLRKELDPEKHKKWSRDSYHRRKQDVDNTISFLYSHAKRRAKTKNLPFTLEKEDIIIPEYCPIMGTKITPRGENLATSASIDRIIPELGYTKENIRVISTKANQMKWDATAEELEMFCRGMLKALGKVGCVCH